MMSNASKKQLPFREWPADDRQRWEAVFKSGDLFDDASRGAHLAPSTREALRVSYAQYLRFITDHHHGLLDRPPEVRLNREVIAEYVSRLRRTWAPPPRTVIGAPSQACGQGRNYRDAFSVLRSLCRTHNDVVRDNTLPHEPPQGDQ
jgi:hypothetical protein